jgi:hypothetical protein
MTLFTSTEMLVSYVDPAMPLAQRHMELNRTFMFDCCCNVKGKGER